MPGCRLGPSWRVVSPSGGSTLITSAPRSPSCCAAHGPSTTVVQSMIRSPASGPVIVVPSRVRLVVSLTVILTILWMAAKHGGNRLRNSPQGSQSTANSLGSANVVDSIGGCHEHHLEDSFHRRSGGCRGQRQRTGTAVP